MNIKLLNKYIYISNIKIDCYNYLLPKLTLLENKIINLIDDDTILNVNYIYLNPCIDEIKFKNTFNQLLLLLPINKENDLYKIIYDNIDKLFECMILFNFKSEIKLNNENRIKADDIYKFMKSNPNITKYIEQYIRYQDNLANVDNNDWNINILIYNSGNIEYYNDDLKNKYLNCNIYIYGNIAKSEILNKIKGGKHLIYIRRNRKKYKC